MSLFICQDLVKSFHIEMLTDVGCQAVVLFLFEGGGVLCHDSFRHPALQQVFDDGGVF